LSSFLEGLNTLQESAHPLHLRELFVELSLSVPVKLSALIPCLRLLIKPLILALEGSSDLCVHGLRVLELCVTKLGKDFLEPFLTPVKPRLMRALWKHLRPPPYKHASQVLRILGRMAGRNRDFFDSLPKLGTVDNIYPGFTVQLKLTQPFDLELQDAILTAKNLIWTEAKPPNIERQKDAFAFLKSSLICLLQLDCMDTWKSASPPEKEEGPITIPSFVEPTMEIEGPPGTFTLAKTKAGLESETETCRVILATLIISPTLEYLQEDAGQFIEGISRHFALLFTFQRGPSYENLTEISPFVFVEAVMDACTSENREFCKPVAKVLDIFVNATEEACGTKLKASQLPVYDRLALLACQYCNQREWHNKAGGCFILTYFMNNLDVAWVRRHEIRFVRALLFILRELSPSVSVTTVEEAASALTALITKAHTGLPPEQQSEVLQEVVVVLVSELSAPNARVRKSVKGCLEQLTELTGISTYDLLQDKVSGCLLNRIFAQPLKFSTRVVQTGHLDAITFCLGTKPPVLSFSPQLVALLTETLGIVKEEEVFLPVNQKVAHRVAAIEFMTAIMGLPEFMQTDTYKELQGDIIFHFFSALMLRSEQIISVAQKSLELVCPYPPKDLLKMTLRPILLNLADYRKLSVPLLEGLARLLLLLRSAFNTALGDKLLEHLEKWTEPEKLLSANKAWKPSDLVKIPTTIIDLFHLLPAAAVNFLAKLVEKTIKLELNLPKENRSLPKILNSPYRLPLIRFLNKYPSQSISYFLHALREPSVRQLFWFILKSDAAGPLRQELVENHETEFIGATFNAHVPGNQNSKAELQFQGILIVCVLSKHIPDYLEKHPAILQCLIDVWRSQDRLNRLRHEENLPLHQVRESKLLVKCFLGYCLRNPAEIKLLFDMLSIVALDRRTTVDYDFLRNFFTKHVPSHYSQSLKHEILTHFFEFFNPFPKESREVTSLVTAAIKLLIGPIIQHELENPSDEQLIQRLVSELVGASERDKELAPKGPNGQPLTPPKEGILALLDPSTTDNSLSIELLRLCTVLVTYKHALIQDYRKQLIKFAWIYLKVDDPTTQQASYAFVCSFIKAYDTPSKIVIQVYCQLLKAFNQEAKGLVREGLATLLPTLSQKLPPEDIPIWVTIVRKVMIEDGAILAQISHILQLIVRHSELFYPFSALFLPTMVSNLHRSSMHNSPTLENRQLSLKVVSLILNWEKKRREEDAEKAEESSRKTVPTSLRKNRSSTLSQKKKEEDEDAQVLRPRHIETIVYFLIKMISTDFKDGGSTLRSEAESLLRQTISMWPDVSIRFEYIESVAQMQQRAVGANAASQANDGENREDGQGAANPPAADAKGSETSWIVTCLKLLSLILDYQLLSFVKTNSNKILKLLMLALDTHENDINKTQLFTEILAKIMEGFPKSSDFHVQDLYQRIQTGVATLFSQEPIPLQHLLVIFNKVVQVKPDFIVESAQNLVFVIEKLITEHCQPQFPPDQKGHEGDSTLADYISLFGKIIPKVQTQYRGLFLGHIFNLLQHSNDEALLIVVLPKTKDWIKIDADSNTKTEFLKKLKRFQKVRSLELHNLFLEQVLDLYQDPKSGTSEKDELYGSVLIGLSSPNPDLRARAFALIDARSQKDFTFRMCQVILKADTWNSIGNTYWIQHSLHLLLALCLNSPLQLSTNSGRIISLAESSRSKSLRISTTRAVGGNGPTPAQSNLLNKHKKFLTSLQSTKASALINPLQSLFHHSPELAHSIWVSLFPKIWNQIPKQDRDTVNESLPNFLACMAFVKQARNTPNVVQTLLAGFRNCDPSTIDLGPALINYCARNFNCYHLGIHLLEKIYVANPGSNDTVFTYVHLSNLYRSIAEEDFYYGLCSDFSTVQDSRVALVFQHVGMWQKAQQVLTHVQRDVAHGVLLDVPLHEQEMWRSHWEDCSRRLNQWELLCEFAKANKRPDLIVQTCWKIGQWGLMEETFKTNSLLNAESPQIKILQSFVLLRENKTQEVDSLCKHAMSYLVTQWTIYPSLPSIVHTQMLHSFQRIMELYETSNILKLLATPKTPTRTNEIRSFLQTWQQRLPNFWDDISIWNELLAWRQVVFSLITSAYANERGVEKQIQLLGQHETAWSLNKFAHIARLQGLEELCFTTLRQMPKLPSINANHAFEQLKQEILCYLKMPSSFKTGLDLINMTNLEHYDAQQKAELYYFKGELYTRMGYHEQAKQAYAGSIGLCKDFDLAWIGWGRFWDNLSQLTPKNSEESNKNAKNALQYYLQGVRCNHQQTKAILSRVLWILTLSNRQESVLSPFDCPKILTGTKRLAGSPEGPSKRQRINRDGEGEHVEHDDQNNGTEDTPETLTQVFGTHSALLPEWLWIVWITEMLSALDQPHGGIYKNLLCKVATKYPQALFYELTTYIQRKQKLQEYGGPSQGLDLAREVLNTLLQGHPSLHNNLSLLSTELSQAFIPSIQEDLCNLLQIALRQCYSTQEPQLLKQRLHSYFQAIEKMISRTASSATDQQLLVNFTSTFSCANPAQINISQLTVQLKTFLKNIQLPSPKTKPLETVSLTLAQFQDDQLQIPGQYTQTVEPTNDHHYLIEKINSPITILEGGTLPRVLLSMRANNGQSFYFFVETGHRKIDLELHNKESSANPFPVQWNSELRFSKLFRYLDVFLKENPQAKKRHVYSFDNVFVPLDPFTRLHRTAEKVVSHWMVYQDWVHEHGFSTERAFETFKHSYPNSPQIEKLLETRKAVIQAAVPDYIFSDFVIKKLVGDYDSAWHFKKHYTTQIALASLVSYLFSVPKRDPFNSSFSPETAQIQLHNFAPVYSRSGFLLSPQIFGSGLAPEWDVEQNNEATERCPLPFALASNIQTFIGPIGLIGLFNTVTLTTMLALGQTETLEEIKNQLCLFFEGDVFDSFSYKKAQNSEDMMQIEEASDNVAEANVGIVLRKMKSLTPEVRPDLASDCVVPINHEVAQLLEASIKPANLAVTDASLFPWY